MTLRRLVPVLAVVLVALCGPPILVALAADGTDPSGMPSELIVGLMAVGAVIGGALARVGGPQLMAFLLALRGDQESKQAKTATADPRLGLVIEVLGISERGSLIESDPARPGFALLYEHKTRLAALETAIGDRFTRIESRMDSMGTDASAAAVAAKSALELLERG